MPDARSGPPVAVVTGGGRNIGAAIAERLAEDGFAVAIIDLDPAAAQRTTSRIAAGTGARTLALEADVRDAGAVGAAFERIAEWGGRLDALVNNAAIPSGRFLAELDEERWDLVIDTNLKGTFLCIRSAVPYLVRSGGGAIVNLSAASLGYAGHFEYSASKGGIDALTVTAALELAPSGIRVNCVAPGPVAREGADPGALAPYIAETPAGRLATPRDIAEVVAFLCGSGAEMVIGQRIQVSGGRSTGAGIKRARPPG
jgi:3-oxoacyl-[acyl-carrier protein] reductase